MNADTYPTDSFIHFISFSHLSFNHRLILQSFVLASKLIERAEAVRLEEKCVRQLAGSFHCNSCLLEQPVDSGSALCRSTCTDIISECINTSELSAISKSWKELAQSLKKLVDSMVAQYNPETIFASYPSLLSEALEVARSKNEISKTVCRISSPLLIAISQLVMRRTASLDGECSASSVSALAYGNGLPLASPASVLCCAWVCPPAAAVADCPWNAGISLRLSY